MPACGHMVGLYFSTAFEVRYVQMICFSQWDVSGSDVCHSQTDVAEPGCESPCSLFPVTCLPAVIQMESAPSLGPRRRKGGAERWLTYNGCEVWVRSSLCSCKTQHFCGCLLPSCFTGLGKLRKGLDIVPKIMSDCSDRRWPRLSCWMHLPYIPVCKQQLEPSFQTSIS